LGSIRAALVHVANLEWCYVHRLNGRDYVRTDSPFTVEPYPGLAPFVAACAAQ
jgi:hypothetical protein